MNNRASLQLGGDNWAAKDGNLLAYKTSLSEKNFLPIEFTFTRGADIAATRVNSSGLIEKYRENLLTYSNDFSGWSKVELDLTPNQEDPFGGNTASLITTTGTTFGWIRQQPTNTGVQSISFYAKAGSNTKFTTSVIQSPYPQVTFTLTGTGSISSNASPINSTISSVGNDGWYKCSMTYNMPSSHEIRFYPNDIINETIGDSAYIYGFQLERGLAATDYLESGATTGKAGVLEDLPRINYSGSTPSLLLEPSRTNVWEYSEYLDYSFDSVSSVTITQNTTETLSPEDLYNATKLEGVEFWSLRDFIGGTDTGTWTISCYVKAVNASSNNTFRLSVGGNNFSSNLTATSEWQRFDFSVTNGGATAAGIFRDSSANDADLYIYGLQVEAGSYATSYIPTYGTVDERVRDYFDSNADFTNFFETNQGTIYIETAKRLFKNETNNETFIGFREDSSGNYWRIIGREQQVFVQCIGWASTITYIYGVTNPTKYLFKWDGTNVSFYIDGALIGTAAQTATFSPNAFGRTGGGVSMSSQELLKQFTLFPTALSDADCRTLTT